MGTNNQRSFKNERIFLICLILILVHVWMVHSVEARTKNAAHVRATNIR